MHTWFLFNLKKKFLAALCVMWDLSSLTRDGIRSPCRGRWSLTTGLTGESKNLLFFFSTLYQGKLGLLLCLSMLWPPDVWGLLSTPSSSPVLCWHRLHAPEFTQFWHGEGNGYPLQDSCLEKPMDREACWAAVHGVTESDTAEQLTHLLSETLYPD